MKKIYFRYASMGAGKTTSLLQIAYNYRSQRKKVLIMKPAIDTKGNDTVVSRIGLSYKVDHLIKSDETFFDIFKENNWLPYKDTECLLIDEAQFLTVKQVDELAEMAALNDITIMCFGLRTDFRGEGFEGSTRLLQIAEIQELKTVCQCKENYKAVFNVRKINGEFQFDGDQICIDDPNNHVEYISLCPKCYYGLKRKYSIENNKNS